ncbi:MAG TPA: M20/M25/M40 family metallo-hydrolase, partial [Thermoanaerobaculia bacterium]|nr:M20/M25/M40 family metallo-hydrolase [Thermoanaerobaculia bacterium]
AELRRTLERESPPHGELFPEVPYVPVNVGTIHGGSAINVVPDFCAVEVGLRPLPGMDSASFVARVSEAARAAAAPLVPEVEILSDSPPMLLDTEAPILRHLKALVGQSEDRSVSFATDAGWLSRLGMGCAIWGPGTIEVAHKPNEFLPKSELAAARDLLSATLRRFCVEGIAG